MSLTWKGRELRAKLRKAQVLAVDATMSAGILDAKAGHGAGAHAQHRFVTRTGEAERSIRIVDNAQPDTRGVVGRWGSKGIRYFRRLELGFQGKDSLGRVYDQRPYPSLVPAARVEYPNLAGRIRRALRRGRV